MHPLTRRAVAHHLTLLVALTPAALGAGPADAHPDFSGSWTLVPERTDDPHQGSMQRPERADAMGSTHGGRTRRTPTDGASTPDADTFEQLDITDGESLLEVTYGDGRQRTLYTDGRDLGAEGGSMRVGSGRWEGEKLVLTRSNERGTLTETWELSAAGELVVTTEMESSGRGRSRSFVRTYTRESSG